MRSSRSSTAPTYIVKSVATREKKRNPVPPFITSTLQQESSRKLRFSVKRTMMLAQRLYEGVELGKEGAVGLITYMRTDSTRVSDDALDEVRGFIERALRRRLSARVAECLQDRRRTRRTRTKPFVRPRCCARRRAVEKYLAEDELKLYRLIWMRFVASQMMPAVFDQTTIDVDAKGKDGASTCSAPPAACRSSTASSRSTRKARTRRTKTTRS